MTTEVATKKIDVDTHFLPRIDFDKLKAQLPSRLTSGAQDMYLRDTLRALTPVAVRAATTGIPVDASDYAPSPLGGGNEDETPSAHRDAGKRAQDMATTGFDMQVLIPDGIYMNLYGAAPYGGDLPFEIRLALCRMYNDAAAAAQKEFPDRFIGVGIVPFDSVEATTQETTRAVKELGLKAVTIPANWGGKNLDDMELYPFWDALNTLGATTLVHHVPQGCLGSTSVDHLPRHPIIGQERMRRLHIGTYLGFGLEYTMAAASLTLGGILDEFPQLKFCFFEAGASWLPYAMYGADRSFEIEPQCSRTATHPSELMRKHFLTAVEPAEHLEALVSSIGSELFFFGSDFPHPEYQTYHNTPSAIADRPGLSAEDKANILGGNISRVLNI